MAWNIGGAQSCGLRAFCCDVSWIYLALEILWNLKSRLHPSKKKNIHIVWFLTRKSLLFRSHFHMIQLTCIFHLRNFFFDGVLLKAKPVNFAHCSLFGMCKWTLKMSHFFRIFCWWMCPLNVSIFPDEIPEAFQREVSGSLQQRSLPVLISAALAFVVGLCYSWRKRPKEKKKTAKNTDQKWPFFREGHAIVSNDLWHKNPGSVYIFYFFFLFIENTSLYILLRFKVLWRRRIFWHTHKEGGFCPKNGYPWERMKYWRKTVEYICVCSGTSSDDLRLMKNFWIHIVHFED